MNLTRMSFAISLIFGLALVVAACGGPAAPSPTSTTPPAPAKAAAPTVAPTAAPTAVPTAPPATPPPPTATTAPVPTKPAAAPTATGVSLADITARARAATEYSYEMRMSGTEIGTGKGFVKGTKTRQEITVQGQQVIAVIDYGAKTAFVLQPNLKMAAKMDFTMAAVQSPRYDSLLSSDARLVGTETVDGKPAAVYEQTTGFTGKYWVWIERGLPLKVETTTGGVRQVIEFLNYQFGSQPDSLFEVPADYQTIEMPAGIPGIPGAPAKPGAGAAPVPGPGTTGAPAIPTMPAIPGLPTGLPGGITIPSR